MTLDQGILLPNSSSSSFESSAIEVAMAAFISSSSSGLHRPLVTCLRAWSVVYRIQHCTVERVKLSTLEVCNHLSFGL